MHEQQGRPLARDLVRDLGAVDGVLDVVAHRTSLAAPRPRRYALDTAAHPPGRVAASRAPAHDPPSHDGRRQASWRARARGSMIDGSLPAQVKAAEQPHLDAGEPLMQRASAGLARVDGLLRAGTGGPRPSCCSSAAAATGATRCSRAPRWPTRAARSRSCRPAVGLHEEGLAAARASGAVVDDPEAGGRPSRRRAPGSGRSGAAVLLDGVLGTGTSADPALRGRP